MRAITAPEDERRRRMKALRKRVSVHDVQRWATLFLESLASAPQKPHVPPAQVMRRCEAPRVPTGPTSGRRITRQSRPQSSDSDKHRVPRGCRLRGTATGTGRGRLQWPSRTSSSTLCKPGRCPPRRRHRGYRVKARSRDACGDIGVKPNDFRTALCVRSAEQPGSVDPHRQRRSTQTAHHSAAESQNQAAPSSRAHKRMTPQPADPPPLGTGMAKRHSLPPVGCSRCPPGRPREDLT